MKKDVREFIDKDHEVMDLYYDLTERAESLSEKSLIKELKLLIKKDPEFFDTYTWLIQILEEQGKFKESLILLNEAYAKCLKVILDKNKSWPDRLDWGWLENRHILRLLLNKGIYEWKVGNKELAREVFRRQLKLNPNDNAGVRQFILAIRMNLTFDQFEKKFNKDGYYDSDLMNWFDKNFKKFPEEFDSWLKEIEQ